MFNLSKKNLDRFTEMLSHANIPFSIEIENEADDTNYCMEMDQLSDGQFIPTIFTHVKMYHDDFVFDKSGSLVEVIH